MKLNVKPFTSKASSSSHIVYLLLLEVFCCFSVEFWRIIGTIPLIFIFIYFLYFNSSIYLYSKKEECFVFLHILFIFHILYTRWCLFQQCNLYSKTFSTVLLQLVVGLWYIYIDDVFFIFFLWFITNNRDLHGCEISLLSFEEFLV